MSKIVCNENKMFEDAIKLAWEAVAYWPPKKIEVCQVNCSDDLEIHAVGRCNEEVTLTLERKINALTPLDLAREYYKQVREGYVKALNLPYMEAKIRLRAIPEILK